MRYPKGYSASYAGNRVLALIIAFLLGACDAEPIVSLKLPESNQLEPGAYVQIDASESKDPEGKQLKYRWDLISGPAGFALESTELNGPTISFKAPHYEPSGSENKILISLQVSDPASQVVTSEMGFSIVCSSEWDTDCDGLPDNVETYKTNAEKHSFSITRRNIDPSIPQGNHNLDGCLDNGINLPSKGIGYYQLAEDPDDRDYGENYDDWGTLKAISCIESVGRKLVAENICEKNCLGVNDISLPWGGYFTPHKGHRNGTELDVRYLRTDRAAKRLSFDDPTRKKYDHAATTEAIKAFLSECQIERIILDQRSGISRELVKEVEAKYGPRVILYDNKCDKNDCDRVGMHHDHFHVRIQYTPGRGPLTCKNP